jgi:hypothetical protein
MSERVQNFFARLDVARAAFEAAIAATPEAGWSQVVDGDLTRTDLLAHIEWWERRGTYEIRTLIAGGTPEITAESLDELNARVTAENRGREASEVRAAEAAAWAELRAVAAGLTEAQLYDEAAFPFLEGDPLKKIIKIETSAHWTDHLGCFG